MVAALRDSRVANIKLSQCSKAAGTLLQNGVFIIRKTQYTTRRYVEDKVFGRCRAREPCWRRVA